MWCEINVGWQRAAASRFGFAGNFLIFVWSGGEIISLDYSAWYVNWLMINIFLTLNGQGDFPNFLNCRQIIW